MLRDVDVGGGVDEVAEELVALADIFIARGVGRIRLTGGEPLVRRGIMDLVHALGERIGNGLEELTLTTNGTQLEKTAASLHAAGIRRVNVSLDTRDPARFRSITRRGDLGQVLRGVAAARDAGHKVKINMVGLKGLNEDEIEDMLLWRPVSPPCPIASSTGRCSGAQPATTALIAIFSTS